jgi:hypothetical protein
VERLCFLMLGLGARRDENEVIRLYRDMDGWIAFSREKCDGS